MIKMGYPAGKVERTAFNKSYLDKLVGMLGLSPDLNVVLNKISAADGRALTWQRLLVSPFEELSDLHTQMTLLAKSDQDKLELLAQYDQLQPQIAAFFMTQQNLILSSCFYCNIDSIYSFNTFADFRGPLDFIQRADRHQLELIDGIGPAKSKVILDTRKISPFQDINECPVSPTILLRILDYTNLRTKATHNHFTLDHFYPQSDHPLLSLCLYNFVPCCYACNSKFKKAAKLSSGDLNYSSPTSGLYSFADEVHFRIISTLDQKDIHHTNDFLIELHIPDHADQHRETAHQLKLHGRYFHYKNEALRLIRLKVDYPLERMEELSRSLGIPVTQLKQDIYGQELFESNRNHHSLVKFKRDIARNIQLIK